MNRLMSLSRSLLGLDDVLSEDRDDPRRKLRWRVGIGATIVVGLVTVAIAVVVSTMNSLGHTTSIPAELSSTHRPTTTPGTPGSPSAAVNNSASDTLVHVVGAVRTPGIYYVSHGARVLDAVMAAGGFTDAAQQCAVNMARTVSDGEQLTIPIGDANDCSTTAGQTKKVSLNRASVTELDALPGIGPTLAQRIVDWRSAHGSFTALTQITQVSGVSEKLFASVKDQLTL
jgi:competence protein ComEA